MKQVLIIGTGLSGLVAARELKKHGIESTLLDKGRGVGGRLATRRFDGAIFDHGAQFFTARSDEFKNFLQGWDGEGITAEWFCGYPSPGDEKPNDDYPRFRSLKGMTAIAKSVADGLDIHLGETVTSLNRKNETWTAKAQSGAEFQGAHLILTPPVPQSLVLLDASGITIPTEIRDKLAALSYEPCFALMVLLESASKVPTPGALYLSDETLGWIADNYQKGVSPVEGAVTIHATGKWTREHYDEAPEIVAQALIEAAQQYLGSPVKSWQLHRWRYSKPEGALDEGVLSVDALNLTFAGDIFNGAKVEGALLSGLAAARKVLEREGRLG